MYIGEDEVRAALSYGALIPAIGQALVDYSAGRVEQPARMILRAGNAEGANNGWFALMPALAGDVMGVKTVTFYPGNAELGLPTHMAVIGGILGVFAVVAAVTRDKGEGLGTRD